MPFSSKLIFCFSLYLVYFLFVVLEEGCTEDFVLPDLNKHIENALLPEERPAQIFVLDKKPIRGFKTDRKYLKERYIL